MRLLNRYKQLSSVERGLFFHALMVLVTIRIGLRLLPYRMTRKWLEHFRTSLGLGRDLGWQKVRQVAWAVDAASRRIRGTTCLPRGMATHLMLGRLGQDSQLRLGVTRNDKNQFEAHAWVEVNGRVVSGIVDGLNRYVPLDAARGENVLI
jgi:hypothetical protein